MLRRFAGAVLAVVLIWPGLKASSQEPTIQKVAPRAAATLVMLPGWIHGAGGAGEDKCGARIWADGSDFAAAGTWDAVHSRRDGAVSVLDVRLLYRAGYFVDGCGRRIVEVSADTPPCKGKAKSCPSYGGHENALYVLELPVGSIKAHHLAVGQVVNFNLG